MRKNNEVFWILEVLLLTPIALFWISLVSMMFGSPDLYVAIVGQPYSMIRSVLITIIIPLVSAWLAYEYIRENKKEKGPMPDIAKIILVVSLATVAIVLIYIFGQNVLR